MKKRRWIMAWFVWFVWFVFVFSIGVAHAQTVTTLSNNNVTAWSARLYGGFADLPTNTAFGYDMLFYYGTTDGSTNPLAWENVSSSTYVEPTGTNDNFGVFASTIIELAETNAYYYRAVADDLFGAFIWATQSMNFVTAGRAPANMPGITHKSVTVLPDGTLHDPPNFFEANGIVPTSGVQQLFIRVTSNETIIAMLITGAFNRAGGDISGVTRLFNGLHLQPRSNAVYMVSRPIFFHAIGDTMQQTNSFHMWFNGEDLYGATSSVFGATIGRKFWTQFNDYDLLAGLLPQMTLNSGQVTNREAWGYWNPSTSGITNPVNIASALTTATLRVLGEVYLASPGTPTNVTYARYFKGIASPASDITDINITGGDMISFSGPGGKVNINGGVSWAGSPRGSVLINGHTFSETNVILNGSVHANGAAFSNIPVTALRLANLYTGGVMRLVTTDGINFFLQ